MYQQVRSVKKKNKRSSWCSSNSACSSAETLTNGLLELRKRDDECSKRRTLYLHAASGEERKSVRDIYILKHNRFVFYLLLATFCHALDLLQFVTFLYNSGFEVSCNVLSFEEWSGRMRHACRVDICRPSSSSSSSFVKSGLKAWRDELTIFVCMPRPWVIKFVTLWVNNIVTFLFLCFERHTVYRQRLCFLW